MTKASARLFLPLLLIALAGPQSARAQALPTAPTAQDREAVYEAVLPKFADSTDPAPAEHVISSKNMGDCTFERFSYKSTNGQTVPALLFIPSTASASKPVPCVILLHGLGGSKEQMASAALALVDNGYAALAIDEYGQGERAPGGGPDDGSTTTFPDMQALVSTGFAQTVVDVRRGIDLLDAHPQIDPKRIGLLGVSLGALIGADAAGVEPRIKATVLVSGGGDIGLMLETAGLVPDPPGQKAGDTLKLTIALEGIDPLTFAPHIAPRSLLMECGSLDTTITPQAAQELYAAASSSPSADVHIDWYPNSGHVPDPDLTEPVIAKWLGEKL